MSPLEDERCWVFLSVFSQSLKFSTIDDRSFISKHHLDGNGFVEQLNVPSQIVCEPITDRYSQKT
jgi:hypothetical protein